MFIMYSYFLKPYIIQYPYINYVIKFIRHVLLIIIQNVYLSCVIPNICMPMHKYTFCMILCILVFIHMSHVVIVACIRYCYLSPLLYTLYFAVKAANILGPTMSCFLSDYMFNKAMIITM